MNPRVRRTESARLQMQLVPRLLILLAPICLVGALASVSSAGQLDRFYPATYAPALSDTTGALVVRPARGDTVQVDIILGEAGGRLSGRVVGPSDEGDPPVGGVIVDAESGAVHVEARTDADGRFEFPALPSGEVSVRIRTDHPHTSGRQYAAEALGPIQVPEGGTAELGDISLHAGGRLRGSVVEALGGSPVLDVQIEAVTESGVVAAVHPPDPTGRFVIGGLEPGSYTVRVAPEEGSRYLTEVLGGGRALDGAEFVLLAGGEEAQLEPIELDLGSEIGGRITTGGLNLVGTLVELRTVDGGETRAVESADFGFYTFVGVPAGTYVVYVPALRLFYPDATRESEARHLVVGEGDVFTRVDVDGATQEGCPLPPSQRGVVTGFVELDMEQVVSAKLRMTSEADTLEMPLESDQFYTFECIPAGSYRIALLTDGPFLPQYHRKVEDPSRATVFEVDADTTDSVDFEPVRGVTVEGWVRASGGEPVEGAIVRLFDTTLHEVASVLTDGDGRYTIDRTPERWGIEAGSFYVRVDSLFVPGPDLTPVSLPRLAAEPEAPGLVRLTIDLPIAPATIQVERSTDGFGGAEAPVLVLQEDIGGGDGARVSRTDAPVPGVPVWYRLTADDGAQEWTVLAGPVVAPRIAGGLSLQVAPSPWLGTGQVRIALSGRGALGVTGEADGDGRLRLFDVSGRWVAQIPLDPDVSTAVLWSPRDRSGRPLSSGVYYLRWSDPLGRELALSRWLVLR